MITGAVELAFARPRPGDKVVLPISDRLSAVGKLLTCYAEGRTVDRAIEQEIIRSGRCGTSTLRRILRRSDYSPQYSVEMGGVAALAGRLVDLAAALIQLRFEISATDQRRFRNLALAVVRFAMILMNRRIPAPVQVQYDRQSATFIPLLGEMEHTVALIPQVFAGCSIHPGILTVTRTIYRNQRFFPQTRY